MLLAPLPARVGPQDQGVHVAGLEQRPPAVEPDDDAGPACAEGAEAAEVGGGPEPGARRPLIGLGRRPHLAQPQGRGRQQPGTTASERPRRKSSR